MKSREQYIRERRIAFLKAENLARQNPSYDKAQAEIIDKSTVASWGSRELKSIYEEIGVEVGNIQKG
jgi:hypothetical protein